MPDRSSGGYLRIKRVGGGGKQSYQFKQCRCRLIQYRSFYINLPVGAVALLMVVVLFEPPKHVRPVKATKKEILLQLDLGGLTLIVSGLLCFVLALDWGGVKMPWSSPKVIGSLTGSILLAMLFGVVQYVQGERAAVIPRIINHRNAGALCAYISL